MSRLAAKVDENQKAVVQEIRDTLPECVVQVLSGVGQGVPDLLIGFQGNNYLIELKDGAKVPSKQKLTEHQVKWHLGWQGQVAVANSAAAVIAAILRHKCGLVTKTAKGKEGA